jgi:hypothetical protein
MKRRQFLEVFWLLAASGAVTACSQSERSSEERITSKTGPPFSADRLHQLLEDLRLAYEGKSLNVSDTLLPPLNENDLRKRCDWFPGEIIPELLALYSWRGGQEPGPWDLADTDHPFWFRDYAFSSLAIAETEYQSMMASYGQTPEFHEMLKTCFPFAAFNGGWLVIPTMPHNFDRALSRPIVSVMEGIDVFFYSIEKMVETCIDWVSNPAYTGDGTLPENVEHEIWRKHNPGVF